MVFLLDTLGVIARIILWLPIKIGRLFGVWCVLGTALCLVASRDSAGRMIMAGTLLAGGMMVAALGHLDRLLRPR